MKVFHFLGLITFVTEFGTLAYSVILLLYIIKCKVKNLFIRYYLILFSLYSAFWCVFIQSGNFIDFIKNYGLTKFVLDISHMFGIAFIVAPLSFAIILISDEILKYKMRLIDWQ
jgi:hypothetical protein